MAFDRVSAGRKGRRASRVCRQAILIVSYFSASGQSRIAARGSGPAAGCAAGAVGFFGIVCYNSREVSTVYDELTEVDIRKMQEEIDYRVNILRPKLLEDVKVARSFGDLSENFEYKAAKREKNRNDSRVRYLERMISTARVISAGSAPDVVGLFDKLVIYDEEEQDERTIQIVTTLRQNALEGLISKESPVGRAVMGRRAGDRVRVEVSEDYSYYIVIRSVEKGKDDASMDISRF